MDIIALLTGKPGADVLAGLDSKLTAHGEHLAALRSDVAVLKDKSTDLSRLEIMVGENARQIASLTSSVGSLARSMEGLEARVDRGEGQLAELRRLSEDVKELKATDEKLSNSQEAVKKTINRWGGGLIVAGIVGGALWGILGVKLSADVAQPPTPIYLSPPAAPAPATEPPARRGRR